MVSEMQDNAKRMEAKYEECRTSNESIRIEKVREEMNSAARDLAHQEERAKLTAKLTDAIKARKKDAYLAGATWQSAVAGTDGLQGKRSTLSGA